MYEFRVILGLLKGYKIQVGTNPAGFENGTSKSISLGTGLYTCLGSAVMETKNTALGSNLMVVEAGWLSLQVIR